MALKLTPEQESAISKMTSAAEITEYLHSLEAEQGLIAKDNFGQWIPTAAATAQPQRFAKVVQIGGKNVPIEADSPETLVQAEIEAFRQYDASQTPSGMLPRRDESGRFTSNEPVEAPTEEEQLLAAKKSELRAKVIRGEILPEEFQPAVDEYTAAQQGIASWRAAADAFLKTPEGANWVGGDDAMNVLRHTIISLGLSDVETQEEQLQAIQTAFRVMQNAPGSYKVPERSAEERAQAAVADADRMLAQNEFNERILKAQSAQEVEEIRGEFAERLGIPTRNSSGVFGG